MFTPNELNKASAGLEVRSLPKNEFAVADGVAADADSVATDDCPGT